MHTQYHVNIERNNKTIWMVFLMNSNIITGTYVMNALEMLNTWTQLSGNPIVTLKTSMHVCPLTTGAAICTMGTQERAYSN